MTEMSFKCAMADALFLLINSSLTFQCQGTFNKTSILLVRQNCLIHFLKGILSFVFNKAFKGEKLSQMPYQLRRFQTVLFVLFCNYYVTLNAIKLSNRLRNKEVVSIQE